MSADYYIRISCPNCESSFAVDYILEEVNGRAEYCPFCGDALPNQDDEKEDIEDDLEEDEEESW